MMNNRQNTGQTTGIVFDIQKFCVQDGPGIRTCVFLKGCMMCCPWCHNPESIKAQIELSYDSRKCIACGACEKVCAYGVHSFSPAGEHAVHHEKCTGCGKCISACPTRCLKLFGKEMTVQEVLQEVCKDKKFFDSSGGGITVTGGEPTYQFAFLKDLLTAAKEAQLHVCLETNGAIPPKRLNALLPYVDLFLFDYKATGSVHRKLTGVAESVVLQALSRIDAYGTPVILRCPIIQGINDDPAHFAAIRQLKQSHSNILQVDVMAYHASGKHKWELLGLPYSLAHLPSATAEMKATWEQAAGQEA